MQQEYKVCVLTKATPGLMGIAAYRGYWPIQALNKTQHFSNSVVVGSDDIKQMMETRQMHLLTGYDLYILQRMQVPPRGAEPLVSRLRKFGGKVVFDTDDRLDNEYRDLGYDGWLQAVVSLCDAITVSTPGLGEAMKKYGKPVYVAYNRLDTNWFSQVSQSAKRVFGDKLVIGTISGRTKWGDLLLITDALKKIAQDYPEVVIACAGYRPPYFEDIKGLNWFSSVRFEAFPGLVRQFDIRLLPLDAQDQFNYSKSACGALEAMAAARPVGKKTGGAVPIVSGDLPVYRRVVNHRHNGLVVKDGKWYEAIAELIEDTTLRKKLSVQGSRWVKKNRDIGGAEDWARAYKAILRQT